MIKNFSSFFIVFMLLFSTVPQVAAATPWWQFQSVDTMKYSRDTSSQFLDNPALADEIISNQVSAIADTGATHIAIATPYDEQFVPILEKWVSEARSHGLSIWFRGNWSGWEGWFGYDSINREQHKALTQEFILTHPELFEEGDIFTACPECENGGPGDPRHNGDASGHRKFLIEEYQLMKEAFRSIGKNIQVNLHPMNGDVARLIMDKPTTQALGGVVTVDHYVRTPQQLATDIKNMADTSGGQVILGEFGAPIPDIHGNFTAQQQADWIEEALDLLAHEPALIGLNYWTGHGGSTAIWNNNNQPRPAVAILSQYFKPQTVKGRVLSDDEKPIGSAQIMTSERKVYADSEGEFVLPYRAKMGNIIFSATGYEDQVVSLSDASSDSELNVMMVNKNPSLWKRFTRALQRFFDRL